MEGPTESQSRSVHILAGSYSITAALGAAAGSRYNAASTEQTATDARKRAQAAYDSATAELAKIEQARSVAELLPLVEAAKLQCRVRVDGAGRQTVCAKPSGLLAELGRAHRRSELQDKVDKANAALNTGPVRQANSDANALGRYLSAVGLDVGPARLFVPWIGGVSTRPGSAEPSIWPVRAPCVAKCRIE